MKVAVSQPKIDFEKELERSRADAVLRQTAQDQAEIRRRMQAVKDGTETLLVADEMWASLEKMGY